MVSAMAKFTDRRYLLTEQYQDAANLNARIALHERFSTNPYGWQRWVFDRLDPPAEGRILELGCGPGDLWLENLQRIPATWGITLSDLSPGMVEEAQRNLGASGRQFACALLDAQAIPCADGSFDAVIANHMLYHVPDRERAFAEIRRVLRPRGRFYAATNSRESMPELSELLGKLGVPAAPQRSVLNFNLENGREQLARWFAGVTLHRYDDALVVTEAEPLIAYVLSTSSLRGVGVERTALRELVEGELARHGTIRISKDTGLFAARRPDDAA